MRITFLGSVVPPVRRAQQEMSVFVEVGWDPIRQCPQDQFIFDCGSGVCSNYGSMGIGFGRMNKIFLAHLHADHMSDLAHIYGFGPSADRTSPLYVWGPGPSGIKSPRPPRRLYDDGTRAFCQHLREAMRWHSESFSFQSTSWEHAARELPTKQSWGLPVNPVPVGDDPPYDGYALVPIELDWRKVGGVAYDNQDTGVKITHFPVIHTRRVPPQPGPAPSPAYGGHAFSVGRRHHRLCPEQRPKPCSRYQISYFRFLSWKIGSLK